MTLRDWLSTRRWSAMSEARVGAILVRRTVLVVEPNRAVVVALAAHHMKPCRQPTGGLRIHDGLAA
jgi:hypothetical protein